jgi:hypothetical protein
MASFALYAAEHGVYHSKNSHVTIDVAAADKKSSTASQQLSVGINTERTAITIRNGAIRLTV